MKEITLNEKSPLSRALPKKVINVEMFRAGEQTDSDGDKALFTEGDLEDIISTYNPSKHEAPLIVGHDQDDSTPSLGWVREMWRKGKSLWGKIELTPKAEKLISEGIFKKVSSSFYAPEADANPYKGKLSLRHLALVNIPAVKGLADFRECLSDTITVDFSEKRSKALFKELLDKNTSIMAKPRKKRISNHAEGPMHVTINVGGSSGAEDLPIYDDGGNQLSKAGTPVDYYEDEEEEDLDYSDGDPDFPEDFPEEDESLDEEGYETEEEMEYDEDEELPMEGEEEMPLEEEGGEEEMPMEGEGEEEEMPMEDEGEEAPESLEEDSEIEDISEELDGDDAKISELASSYSPLELAKALMLQKETKNMMEAPNTQDFSECDDEDDEKKSKKDGDKKLKKKKEEDAESKDYSDSDEPEDDESEDFEESVEEFSEDEEETDGKCDDSEEEEKDFSEDEEEDDEDEDSESTESLKDRVARLEKELIEQKKLAREKDISDFCEKVYQGGKLTEQIVTKTDLVRFMSSLNGKNSMNFSEGTRKSQFDFFSDVLENLPQLVSFSEVAPEASTPKRKKVDSPASGYEYDKSNLDIHAKALEFSEAKGVDYVTALKSVID